MRTALAAGLLLALLATPVMAQDSSPSAEPTGSPEPLIAASPDPSMSPEAGLEPECVQVDPATLPKGAAKFENAVADLEADLAKIHERAATASAKQSANVLQDLWSDAQDFARAVDKAKFNKKLKKAANDVVGRVVLETEFAGGGLAGTKLDPLPDILYLPDGHAAIEEFRAVAGYSWPCESSAPAVGTVPEASPAPAVSPVPSPSALPEQAGEPGPSAEPLALGPYRIGKVLNGNNKRITAAQLRKIANGVAPIIAPVWYGDGFDDLDEGQVSQRVKQTGKDLANTLVLLGGGPGYKVSGKFLVNNIVATIGAAQDAARQGNRELADAFMKVAQADYRAGLTWLKTDEIANTFDKSVFVRDLKKRAKKQGVQ